MASENVPIEQFFNQQASGALVEEANRFRAVPKDSYNVQIAKVEGKIWKADDPEKKRNVAQLTVNILKGDKKIATVWTNVSWEERRYKDGKLDMASRLWGQLQKSLFPTASGADLAAKTVGEVIEAATRFPVGAYVGAGYKVPQLDNPQFTNVRTPRTPEEETEYRTKGYKHVNEILSFSKHQEGR